MTTLGTVFLPQLPPERLRAVARAADEAGLDELWLWEDCFYESGIASAAAALAWTGRLRVGVGLLPVPLRNVALAAMEVATLHRLFPGRVTIGVGHGVQDWMAQVGARVQSPVTLLHEHLAALRALLRGERVSVSGRYVRLDDVALDWPPRATPAPAVLAGAVGPRTLRLSGELADGTILTAGTDADGVRRARRLVDEGRAAAGRTDPHPLVVYLRGDAGPARDAAGVAEAVQRWADAGADTVVLQPTADDPDPEGFVRFVATEVRALVRSS
jgi:alkanesulfonate monooxygenase SsuD/methylene tetrahydromethanopterin reductase-like flavin-dependent oxidoreductase (luciferase family)